MDHGICLAHRSSLWESSSINNVSYVDAFGRVVSVFTWASNLRLTYYNASIMQFNTCVINLLYPLQCGFLWPSMCTVHRSGDVQMQVLQSPELLKWPNSEERKVFQVKSLNLKVYFLTGGAIRSPCVSYFRWGHILPVCGLSLALRLGPTKIHF